MMQLWKRLAFLIVALPGLVSFLSAAPQTPRVAPRAGFQFLDERTVGMFTVQRWMRQDSPEPSAAGMCECIQIVYLGTRNILTLNPEGAITGINIDPGSGSDIDKDGQPDLIVSEWSGGAHCCYSTSVYSVGSEARSILSADTGNCMGSFEDLDGDGKLEFTTCDDRWAYAHCSFAASPMPTVIYAYDADARKYVPSTPKYAGLRKQAIEDLRAAAEKAFADSARDPEQDKCVALGPVLELMYSGRFDEGINFLRRVYRAPDREEFEAQTIRKVQESAHWVAR
jgi:hypothetical protein